LIFHGGFFLSILRGLNLFNLDGRKFSRADFPADKHFFKALNRQNGLSGFPFPGYPQPDALLSPLKY
jgi:hypothetical protein